MSGEEDFGGSPTRAVKKLSWGQAQEPALFKHACEVCWSEALPTPVRRTRRYPIRIRNSNLMSMADRCDVDLVTWWSRCSREGSCPRMFVRAPGQLVSWSPLCGPSPPMHAPPVPDSRAAAEVKIEGQLSFAPTQAVLLLYQLPF